MARIKSLKELGKGKWKIVSITPLKPAQKKIAQKGIEPQEILFNAVKERWPEAVSEYPLQIPNRKFRADIAFVEQKLIGEMDGWQWHGKFLADFKRDRARQNLLVVHGWRVIRFTAADVHKDLEGCLNMIETALKSSQLSNVSPYNNNVGEPCTSSC